MDWQLTEGIDFRLDEEDFLREMHISPGSRREQDCRGLCKEAQELARPRALWLKTEISRLDNDSIVAGGVCLSSPLFAPRLKVGQQIYPYLATAGPEISCWCQNYRDNIIRSYWADCLAELALRAAMACLEQQLTPIIGGEYLASFAPGSLASWPIEQQKPLFELLGPAGEACGVSLSEQYVMSPQKSVSGFYFASEVEYYNCELCPRLRCPRRRAEFAG